MFTYWNEDDRRIKADLSFRWSELGLGDSLMKKFWESKKVKVLVYQSCPNICDLMDCM